MFPALQTIIDEFRQTADDILLPAWEINKKTGQDIEAQNKVSQNQADPLYASEVTEYDLAAEKRLKEKFENLIPGMQILAEESTSGNWREAKLIREQDNKVLTLDPIDGTTSFRKGGSFALMAAFRENAVPKFSVIYYPVERETFFAVDGGGSWRLREFADGTLIKAERLQIPSVKQDRLKLFCHRPELLEKFTLSGKFAEVSDGYLSAAQGVHQILTNEDTSYVHVYRDPIPWDALPTTLLIREAGGDCFDTKGRDIGNITSQTGHLFLSPGGAATDAVRQALALGMPH